MDTLACLDHLLAYMIGLVFTFLSESCFPCLSHKHKSSTCICTYFFQGANAEPNAELPPSTEPQADEEPGVNAEPQV